MPTDQDLSKLIADVPIAGAALAVIENGAVAVRQAAGWANAGEGAAVTQATVFEAASLGKPVFAYAVLKLVDAGVLSLDEPLHLLAPDIPELDEHTASITARHVLSHAAGLPNWRSAERPFRRYFPPGQRFSYSGEGFFYLQRVLERASGESLEALTRRLVFTPLGMERSSFDCATLSLSDMAVPHDASGEPLAKRAREPNAASSLHTTAGDYARFLQAVLSGEGLSEASWAAWMTPNQRVPARFFAALDPVGEAALDPVVAWGLGWGLEGDTGTFFHWGSNPGFKSFVLGSIPEARAFVVLSTGQVELALGGEIAAAVTPVSRPCLDWFARA